MPASFDDIEHGEDRGLSWNEERASFAIAFIEQLRHSKGEWAGQSFVLSDWQIFIVGSVFGWERAGKRRFTECYNELARKNGKTTLVAAVGLYLAFADGEAGAEVYCAATKRDQAKLAWVEAMRMVKQTPALAKRITITESRSNLSWPALNAKLEPLGRDSDTTSGLNPNGALIDELHEHPNRGMVDVLETAMGARREPLTWFITTAGSDSDATSIWWEKRSYAVQVLEKSIDDDNVFVYIATLDDDDDWTDEAVWPKANPNLGISVYLDKLRADCQKAQEIPAYQNTFIRLNLNKPTAQAERWIDMATWNACDDEPVIPVGASVIAALDMASTIDLSAGAMVYLGDDGHINVRWRFWRPEATVVEAEKRDRVPYRLWAEQGYLTLTDGSMMDDVLISDEMLEWAEDYNVREWAFDMWNARGAAARVEAEGGTVVAMAQGFQTFSEPCHKLEGLLASRRLRHGGNPIATWMAGQMMVQHGPNEAIRPFKPKGSGIRNDGIVALLMGMARLSFQTDDDGESNPLVVIDLS